jgi:hypothetical protein
LNTHSIPPLPSIDDLESWGVPAGIIQALRGHSMGGEAEEAIVAAFLHVLARCEAGRALHRQVRRQIISTFKLLSAKNRVIDRISSAIESCAGWESVKSVEFKDPVGASGAED